MFMPFDWHADLFQVRVDVRSCAAIKADRVYVKFVSDFACEM